MNNGIKFLAAGIAALAVMPCAHAQEPRMVNRIVAIVNDDVITQTDLELRVRDLIEASGQNIPVEMLPPEAFKAALKQLVDQQLIVQQAADLEVKVSNDEVTEEVHTIRQRLQTEAAFEDWLDERGITYEQLRRQIRNKLLAQRVVDEAVRPKVRVSPQEVQGELKGIEEGGSSERVAVAHILVRVNEERSDEEAQNLIESAAARLKAGEPFDTVSKDYSDDPNAGNGGRLGWVERGQLLPELDAAAFRLGRGEISDIIRTRLGYHIIVVEDVEDDGLADLDPQRRAFMRVYERKFNDEIDRWLKELMEKAYVAVPSSVLSQGD